MSAQIAVRFEPPHGISAAMVGVLLGGKVGVREVGIMIVDLSVRGWFTMEEESDGRWGLRTPPQLPPRDERCSPAEARLMDVVFRPGLAGLRGETCPVQYVSLTTIRHRLQGHIEEIGHLLGQQVVDDGLMTKNPAQRGFGRRAGLTVLGEEKVAESKGYRLYLTTAEAAPLASGSLQEQFRSGLAYATAFGVLDAWTSRLDAKTMTSGQALLGNPLVYGVGVGSQGGYSWDTLFGITPAENDGARFVL